MNPFQLLQMMRNAKNPMMALQQMAGNNQQMQELLNNLQGKSPTELEQYARNVAQSKNINLEQFLSSFGIRP